MYREPEIVFRNVGIVAWAAGLIGVLWPRLAGHGETLWPLVLLAGVLLLGMGLCALVDVANVRQRITARWRRRFGVFESWLFVIVGAGWLVLGVADAVS